MLFIKPHLHVGATKLSHGTNVFHEALQQGKDFYHVVNPSGSDYDLEYVRNNDLVPDVVREPKKGVDIYPPYLTYDEKDTGRMDLSLLLEHEAVFFESVNEYSVVLAKVALENTGIQVWFTDPLILSFLPAQERLHVGKDIPDLPPERMLRAVNQFVGGFFEHNFHTLGIMPLFHNVFFWQSLTEKPYSDLKYVCIGMARNVGIGGILSYYANAQRLFAEKGLETFLKKNATRYSDEMLRKYFSLQCQPDDSTAENTILVEDLTSITATYAFMLHSAMVDISILSNTFRDELDQYARAVVKPKTLGVLIRGTDYIVSKMSGARKMATVDDMLPMIREWIREDHYEKIFLATEDQDILNRMEHEFGPMLRTIAQERHRVQDFTEGMKLLSELEESSKNEPDSEARKEDNLANYLYALYCLSKCESFMASGQCHGWDVVLSVKEGEFKRTYKFAVGVKKEQEKS